MEVVKPSSSGLIKEKTSESYQQQSTKKKSYNCMDCGRNFAEKFNLNQHVKIHLDEKPFTCYECKKQFYRKSDLERHKKIHSKPPIQHKCEQCLEVFKRKIDLLQHMKKSHVKPPIQHKCEKCHEVFRRKLDLVQHSKKMHSKPLKIHNCLICNEEFTHKTHLIRHTRTSHPVTSKTLTQNTYADKVKHLKRRSALNIFSTTMFESNEENEKDLINFLNSIQSDVLNELNFQISEKRSIKWHATVKVILSRVSQEADFETISPYFHSKTILEFTSDNLSSHIEDAFEKITNSFEEFSQRGSGWTLEKIEYLELSIAKYSIA